MSYAPPRRNASSGLIIDARHGREVQAQGRMRVEAPAQFRLVLALGPRLVVPQLVHGRNRAVFVQPFEQARGGVLRGFPRQVRPGPRGPASVIRRVSVGQPFDRGL